MQVIRTHVRLTWEAILIRTHVRATVNSPAQGGWAGARFVPKPGAPGGPLARAIARPAAASDVPPRGPGHRAVARPRLAPPRRSGQAEASLRPSRTAELSSPCRLRHRPGGRTEPGPGSGGCTAPHI